MLSPLGAGPFAVLLLNQGNFLIVEGLASRLALFGKGIDPVHIGLQQVILVLNAVLNQILELFHFNLHNYLVDLRIV